MRNLIKINTANNRKGSERVVCENMETHLKVRIFTIVVVTAIIFAMSTSLAFAVGPNFGERVGTWVMEQIFWIALVGAALVLLKILMIRAWIPALIFFILAGIILFLIQNPQRMVWVGEQLFGIIQ